MKTNFVQTENARAFMAGLSALDQRGAEEACLMVVDGEPGLGKTTTIEWWATQSGSVFLRAKQEWTPAWFLRELLQNLKQEPEYSFERMFRQAVKTLSHRTSEAARNGKPFAVIIDEADHICRVKRIVETIRDLSDMLEIPFILVGMGRLRGALTRFPQVASRVSQTIEFAPLSIDDAAKMIAALCDVPVKPDLSAFLHKAAAGKTREIKEGIAAIERFGKRHAGQEIGLAEMAGIELLRDRATGRPVTVRAL